MKIYNLLQLKGFIPYLKTLYDILNKSLEINLFLGIRILLNQNKLIN